MLLRKTKSRRNEWAKYNYLKTKKKGEEACINVYEYVNRGTTAQLGFYLFDETFINMYLAAGNVRNEEVISHLFHLPWYVCLQQAEQLICSLYCRIPVPVVFGQGIICNFQFFIKPNIWL